MLRDFLQMKGYEVAWAQTGREARTILDDGGRTLQAAVLDYMVPAPDGPALLRYIRSSDRLKDLPVLFLTAKDQEADELRTLSAGADDYITKPASLARVLTRLEAMLRRHTTTPDLLLVHDRPNGRILAEGKPVDLTTAEYYLLGKLLDQPERVFTRAELLQTASPEPEEALERTVDAHIKNIRAKLGPLGGRIKTYRGRGYGINPEA